MKHTVLILALLLLPLASQAQSTRDPYCRKQPPKGHVDEARAKKHGKCPNLCSTPCNTPCNNPCTTPCRPTCQPTCQGDCPDNCVVENCTIIEELQLTDAQKAKVRKQHDKRSRKIKKARESAQKARQDYMAEMKKILTPQQYAAFELKMIESRGGQYGVQQPGCNHPDCRKPDCAKPDCAKPDCAKPDCAKNNCSNSQCRQDSCLNWQKGPSPVLMTE